MRSRGRKPATRLRPTRWYRKLPQPSLGLWTALLVILMLAGFLASVEYSRPHHTGDRLALDSFVDLAEKDRIKDARFLDVDAAIAGSYVRPDRSVGQYYVPYFTSEVLREELTKDVLLANQIPTYVDQQVGKRMVEPLQAVLPALIIAVVFVYFILSSRTGSGLFGRRGGARKVRSQENPVTFADVAGQDAALTELREIADYLANPDRFAAVGAQIPKGVLLYGPPGCGKTLCARALAGEAGASFFSMSGSDFVELYVGVGAARVRELFSEARENAPAIVFIDELDAVGRRRRTGSSMSTGSHEEQDQALNGILAEMDGFSPMQGIVVLAATNRPDVLDPALLRPGRFDRTVGFETPDEGARRGILAVHVRDKPLAPDVDLGEIAHRAVGMTGADLANVANEASLLTARAGKERISRAEFDQALSRVLDAPERQRRLAMRDRSLGRRSLLEEQVTFAAVAGVDEAVEELAEVRDYLADPERFTSRGARVPAGYLLSGPPGCGKTLLARAVAGEANAPFVSVAGSEFTEVMVGEGAARVRDLFAEARAVAPAIIFIDEIDAIGARREAGVDGHREREQTLNQILIELDGFSQRDAVVVIAATNRPELLDPALVRPGRFDRQVTIDLPDRDGRRGILEVHAAGKGLASDVDLDRIAMLTRGLSGADLANVVNEAALLAGREGGDMINMRLLEEGIERTVSGVTRGHLLSEEERRVTAYHEAGHGLVARAVPAETIMHKLTIIPRGRRLGGAWVSEAGDQLVHSRSLLIDRMAMLLGGRVAEEIAFGEVSAGAADDLARVGEIARKMVRELGMSKAVGALPYTANGGGDPSSRQQISDETARLIDSEVRALVTEAEDIARAVLLASREALDRVAQALMERESLSMDELNEVAGPPVAVDGRGPRAGEAQPPVISS